MAGDASCATSAWPAMQMPWKQTVARQKAAVMDCMLPMTGTAANVTPSVAKDSGIMARNGTAGIIRAPAKPAHAQAESMGPACGK